MIIGLIIILICIFIDQGSKWAVKLNDIFHQVEAVDIIPGWVSFGYTENTGGAYNFLDGQMWFFYIMIIVALIGLGYLFSKVDFKKKKIYTISISLLIAGALGNAIDRVILGYVIDFIHFPIVADIHSIFNFYCNPADIFLTFGIILFMIDLLIIDTLNKKKKEQKYINSEKNEKEEHERNNQDN